jgi:hypothetical protein
MTRRQAGLFLAPALLVLALSSPAQAQQAFPSPAPNRDQGWGVATTVTMGSAALIELVMPRVFYSDPEATVGWKARWHVSQLAPVMTLAVITLTNEAFLKPTFADPRPGCDDTNNGGPHCDTFGMMSTHAFGAGAALGHGAAVWLFDMTKWSDGRFNIGSFVGDVVLPAILGVVTVVGRGAGNWETGGQITAGATTGLGFGFLAGMTYSLMARPECGYTGNLICW